MQCYNYLCMYSIDFRNSKHEKPIKMFVKKQGV